MADRSLRLSLIAFAALGLLAGVGLMAFSWSLEAGLRRNVSQLRIGNTQREVEERLGRPVGVYVSEEAARREAGGHLRSRPENVQIPEATGAVWMYRTSRADELYLLYFDSWQRLERRLKLIHRDGPPEVVELDAPASGG